MLPNLGPALLDALADAIVAADASGTIVEINAATERLLGWPRAELVGRSLETIQPERLRAAHRAGFARFLATRESRILGKPVRVPALRKDGAEIDVELTISMVAAPDGGDLFVASLRDLRERVELERQLTIGRTMRAATLAAARLTSRLDLEHILQTAVESLVHDFGAALARLWVHAPDEGVLHLRASAGLSTSLTGTHARIDVATYPYKVGVVARTRQPFVRNRLDDDPQFDAAWVAREGLRAVAALPLVVAGELRGVFAAFFTAPLDPEVSELLGTFAAMVAASLNDVQLFSRERAAHEWLETTLRSIGDGVIATDESARVVFLNDNAQKLTGWSAAEARGRPVAEVFRVVQGDTAVPQLDPIGPVLRTGAATELASPSDLVRRDGSRVAVADSAAPIRDAGGAVRGVVLVFRDVSANKLVARRRSFLHRATAELGRSLDWRVNLAEAVRLAVPSIADGALVEVVDADGHLQRIAAAHVDPGCLDALASLRAAFPPARLADDGATTGPGTDAPMFVASVAEALSAAAPSHDRAEGPPLPRLRSYARFPLQTRDRRVGVLTMVSHDRFWDDGDRVVIEELAQRMALAIDNANLYEDAQRAVAARDDFLSIASHELRTPLTSLRLLLQTSVRQLRRGDGLDAGSALDKLLAIERQASRLSTLIDQLLDISRIDARRMKLTLEPVDLSAVVAEVLTRHRSDAARAGCSIEVRTPGPLVGRWDAGRLDQVVTNLVGNAIKYGAHHPITIDVRREGEHAVLEVADAGIGIAPEHHRRIFERFERASSSRNYGGFGLGLWIVGMILDALGGTIAVDSALGKGARFTVRLPFGPALPEP